MKFVDRDFKNASENSFYDFLRFSRSGNDEQSGDATGTIVQKSRGHEFAPVHSRSGKLMRETWREEDKWRSCTLLQVIMLHHSDNNDTNVKLM